MRSGNLPTYYWDKGGIPTPFLAAYTVSRDASGYRVFTRNSTYDITDDYIEINSIHYEATNITGEDFVPGGVIPSRLTLKVLKDCPALETLVATPYPASSLDVSIMYQLNIRYTADNFMLYPMGGRMFCSGMSNHRDGDKVGLTFEDELRILDYSNFENLSSFSGSYNLRAMLSATFNRAGYNSNSVEGKDNIPTSTFYYTGDDISKRQLLSLITQICGCSIIGRDDKFIIRPLKNAYDNDYFQSKYVRDTRYDDYSGQYTRAFAEPNDRSLYYTGNDPEMLYVQNPLVTNGNYTVFTTMLDTNCCDVPLDGFEAEILACPLIEPGDNICVFYDKTAEIGTYKYMTVSRLEWNGGAFMKYYEPKFDPVGRLG